MAKVYAIISGKGGVGKTTSTINLGTALNYLGEDVIILDGNLTTPNLGIHLGAPIVPITLNHVLNDQAKVEDAIYEHESGTKVMPASLSLKETERINYKKLVEVTKKLKKITNHILIDSAAGLGEEARCAIDSADEIIIVTNPEMSSVTDALKTIKLAEEKNKPVRGVIITRYSGKKVDMSIANIKDMLESPILGIIPEDDAVKESHIMKNAVIYTHPRSRAAGTYLNTTKRFLGEDLDLESLDELGVFGRFLKRIGLRR
jgi:septum site-determining protein MinD